MKPINQILGGTKYSEMIRSKAWQDFSRRTIKERGRFCQSCKQAAKILQVHHISYDPGYPLLVRSDEDVAVLCVPCHQALHDHLKKFRRFVFGHLNPQSFRVLNGALAVGLNLHDPLELCYAVVEREEILPGMDQ